MAKRFEIDNCDLEEAFVKSTTIDGKTGFTLQEKELHDKIMEAMELFLKLDQQHPCEMREFETAVHILQGILTTRITRRCYPEGWPTYTKKEIQKFMKKGTY